MIVWLFGVFWYVYIYIYMYTHTYNFDIHTSVPTATTTGVSISPNRSLTRVVPACSHLFVCWSLLVYKGLSWVASGVRTFDVFILSHVHIYTLSSRRTHIHTHTKQSFVPHMHGRTRALSSTRAHTIIV